MDDIESALKAWQESLLGELDVAGLYSRSHIAHKWKAPFRSIALREVVSWRAQDLLGQSFKLYVGDHLLGARVLLRSAIETVAVLIYLNQLTRKVLEGKLSFHVYSEKTSILILGSRDGSTPYNSLNIMTILEKCETKYTGILEIYATLSESAHPNYDGLSLGYSIIDHDKDLIKYQNKWKSLFAPSHLDLIGICIEVFTKEYNDEWSELFNELEKWIEDHDEELEATKDRT